MNTSNIVGPRIREARLLKKLDQVELAAALKVQFNIDLNQSDISEIERQFRGVKDYELDAIARVLSVSPTWLLRGVEADG
ncbi:MAG: helix-turn-helix transcriptional regulator [Anaerolineaceae bacterium]|nr:helix-turn-helix transcriptional regulator [Anaerolineaceae bacterium]